METMKKINNLCHYFLGFAIVHAIGNLTDWNDFDTIGKFVAVPILGLFFGIAIGFVIEWIESVVTKESFDLIDIARTMIGGFLGGLFATLFINLNLFMWVTLSISAMLCAVELIFLYKRYKRNENN